MATPHDSRIAVDPNWLTSNDGRAENDFDSAEGYVAGKKVAAHDVYGTAAHPGGRSDAGLYPSEKRCGAVRTAASQAGRERSGQPRVSFAAENGQSPCNRGRRSGRSRGSRKPTAGAGHYRALRSWAGRPEYGNSILVREELATSGPERLELSQGRAAGRVVIERDGIRVLFVNLHLHHEVPDDAIRDEQARIVLEWLAAAPPPDVAIVVGDFNADPAEPAYARMAAAGFRSACLEANGVEPAVPWPSGLQGPAIDTDGEPSCLDYIWVRGAARVLSARVVFDRPSVDDPGLYPSDHFGLSARLQVGPPS